MEIFYTRFAVKQLENIPNPAQKRIVFKMRFFANQRDPLRFAKRLIDSREGDFRFRIGDHRILFDVYKNAIYILRVERRDKAYD
jgi:mRNA interferase RelE/StbE